MKLLVQKLHPDAIIPTIAYESDAGYDLYANIIDDTGGQLTTVIYPGGSKVISTGIAVAIPPGYYGRIAPKSGLAANHCIDVLAGVVDSGYRGEIRVQLANLHYKDAFWIDNHMKIAQLIITKIETPPIEVVDVLPNTERGSRGYGSSGI